MIFVAEYELTWDDLEAAMAKRLEWDDVHPETFRFLGEYVWADRQPAFRGVAIFEAESVEDVNSFVLHYGRTVAMSIHAASDVVSAINATGRAPSTTPRTRSKRRRA